MYLLSRVTWHANGRTEINPEQASDSLTVIQQWLDYNYPEAGKLEHDAALELWRTPPVVIYGSDMFFSVSRIDVIN